MIKYDMTNENMNKCMIYDVYDVLWNVYENVCPQKWSRWQCINVWKINGMKGNVIWYVYV